MISGFQYNKIHSNSSSEISGSSLSNRVACEKYCIYVLFPDPLDPARAIDFDILRKSNLSTKNGTTNEFITLPFVVWNSCLAVDSLFNLK